MKIASRLLLCAAFAAAGYDGLCADDPWREFRCEDGRAVYPSYRTWEFDVDEPGLYVFDIGSDDGKAAPAVREWLDGVQIGYVLGRADWQTKTERTAGHLRRFRWLEKGRHSFDLYLNVGAYNWNDDMERAMNEKGVRATLIRPKGGEAGFWMPDDCMARVAGEPLVVCGCAAGDLSSDAQRKFTMEVCPAGEESPVWSRMLAIGVKPVRFEYPCDKEGAFEYVVRDGKGEVVEGPWDFVVTDIGRKEQTDLLTPNGVRETVSRVSDEQIRVLDKSTASSSRDPVLVDRVDCTEGAGGEHHFREGGKSEIVETPDGAYRLCGSHGLKDVYRRRDPDGKWSPASEGEKGAVRKRYHDWFGYTLKVEHPGRSHALVVRVPNDVRRFTSVVAYDRRTCLSNAWGIDSGDAPAAGPWSEMKIPVWPNTDALDVMVITTDGRVNSHIPHHNRRGAVAELSLFEYPNGYPSLDVPACGWNATREFGWGGEQVNLGPNERTMPPLPDAAVPCVWDKLPEKGRPRAPYHAWNDILLTWDRTFELEAWRGGTTLSYPAYSYGMVTFHGAAQMLVPAGGDVYANGCVGAEVESNPFDRDVFALMLQRAEKHGVKIYSDFMIQRTYADVVAAWCERYGMPEATNGFYLVASADGTPFKPVRCVYAGMLNPVHPAARKVQVEFCAALARRYGRYKSFGGICHRFSSAWPPSFEPWFHSSETGFDDFTVGEFSKATGIALTPVGTNETAFAARKKLIREEYAREWNAWRVEVCRSLHEEMLAAMRKYAPESRFYVGRTFEKLAPETGIDSAVFGTRRELGFDSKQVRITGPGVEINNLDPIHFGNFWVHRPDCAKGTLPPPTGLCCNSSYRCSPYHLEPAALALADNRLDQLWAGGQWCLPPLDDALREFVRAYRAIPDRDDWQRVGESSRRGAGSAEKHTPVAVWWAKDGDDVLFWAVNRTDTNRRVVLSFDKETPAFINCITGNPVNPVNPVKKTLREIKLSPFMPGVFRAKGVGSLLGFKVPVDPEEAAQIEKDYAFLASLGAMPGCATAVEASQGTGETYYSGAGSLGKRDERWMWRDLFAPMDQVHKAGDLLELRRLIADFRTYHRWWFEAFGWPEDLCVTRKVGRAPLVGFLRQSKRTEMWFGETNGVFTANFTEKFPQCKKEFVCAPQGIPMCIDRHGQPGGFVQLEVQALFGGGYGDIRVEDADGKLLGVINASELAECSQIANVHKSSLNTNTNNVELAIGGNCEQLSFVNNRLKEREARLETRVLSVPLKRPFHGNKIRLVGTGEKGLAIYEVDFKALPPRPIREWQVIGPFDKGGGEKDKESYDKTFPPETEPFDPNASYVGMGGETVCWKTVTLDEDERVLNILAAAPHEISKMNGVAYLRTVIKAKRRQPVMLYYANDHYGTIWFNGKPIVPKMRGPAQQYEAVEVWLEKGENVIFVKTSPGSAGIWHFGAAVNDDGTLEFE